MGAAPGRFQRSLEVPATSRDVRTRSRGEDLRPNRSFLGLLSREALALATDAGVDAARSRFRTNGSRSSRSPDWKWALGPGRRSKKSGKSCSPLHLSRDLSCRREAPELFISSWFRRRMVRHGRSMVTCRPGADSGSEQLASESRGSYVPHRDPRALTREDVARFRTRSLGLLEEEVDGFSILRTQP